MRTQFIGVAIALTASALSAAPGIGVHFEGSDESILAPSELAGVPGVAQAHWNNLAGNSGYAPALLDSSGNPTPVTISWWSSGLWSAATQEQMTDQFSGADRVLMDGYLDTYGSNQSGVPFSSGSITLSGLRPNGNYDLYVYDLESVAGRGGFVTANGAMVSRLHTAQMSSSYLSGTNYSLFGDLPADAAGHITLNTDGVDYRTAIQGLQLIELPEPGVLALIGVIIPLLLARRRAPAEIHRAGSIDHRAVTCAN